MAFLKSGIYDAKLSAAHKHLAEALNNAQKAKVALSAKEDISKLVHTTIKATSKTWGVLVPLSQNKKTSTKSPSSLTRKKKSVDALIKKIHEKVKILSLPNPKKPQKKITKKEQRIVSRKIFEDLSVVLSKTSEVTPRLPIERIIKPLLGQGTQIADLSFDIYCPRSYKHHTRLTIWMPRILANGDHVSQALKVGRDMLRACGVKEVDPYVIGINSRVNQYKEQHLLMLDFDNISYEQLPLERLMAEPGVLLRTESGYHFLGLRLYDQVQWKERLTSFRGLASDEHIDLSLQRGYGTLRMTASSRKPFAPIVVTTWKGKGG